MLLMMRIYQYLKNRLVPIVVWVAQKQLSLLVVREKLLMFPVNMSLIIFIALLKQ